MNIFNLIKIAYKSLMRNKMRAFLTMLGIVIGISSVITMVGVGESSQASINNQVSQMGTNLIMVQRARMRERGVSTGRDNVQSLKIKDVDLLAENAKYLSIKRKITGIFKRQKFPDHNKKTHVFRICPECKAKIRLPRKKGAHQVRCPRCKVLFDVHIR